MKRKQQTTKKTKTVASAKNGARPDDPFGKRSPLTDAQIVARAHEWARLHERIETRPRMDKLLEGLSIADQRRVYLCGQRVRGGLTPKIAANLATK